ncbi:hypothetical protein [Nostoc sp. DedQUE09]|uniref:hypothetical protein n=1 Tax=Nostoc sp. DedQUE09 TaxID=3075394 RepID=UPI002AD1E211|nr:hypothetical protein [Nostoc sp. DedQUE09]MDZ7952973.1 hypothetical protein [Nostoc sp. DedQUE09]
MLTKKLTIKKIIEVEVEIEVQLNENEHNPTDFGIDKNEDEFTIQDSENFQESLSEKANEIAIHIANKRLTEAVKKSEDNIKTKEPLYEWGHLELLYITACRIETNDSDWEIISEEGGDYV